MAAARVIVSVVTLSLVAATQASEVRCWQDPVVTYTNGIRLPSTTSLRSHNVYWQCDPHHVGYCDGRMYCPCRNELRNAGSRLAYGYRLPYGTTNPPVPAPHGVTFHSIDGMEMAQGERLGQIPVDQGNTPRLGVAPVATGVPAGAAALPGGTDWLNSLKTLSDKVIQNGATAEALGF